MPMFAKIGAVACRSIVPLLSAAMAAAWVLGCPPREGEIALHYGGHATASIETGTTYEGLVPLSATAPIEASGASELLSTGYQPIGIVRTTVKLEADAVAPLRQAMSTQRGEHYTVLTQNQPAAGDLRIQATYCTAFKTDPNMGGIMALATKVCARYETLDQTSKFALTEATALVWERRTDGLRDSPAWRAGLRRVVVDEHHPEIGREHVGLLVDLCVAAGDAPTLAAALAAGLDLPPDAHTQAEPLLSLAALARDVLAVRALTAAGVRPTAAAVFAGVDAGDPDLVAALVSARGAVDGRDAQGLSPLHRAAARGMGGVVRALVAGGAPIDLTAPDGATPLSAAAAQGQTRVVRLLLELGAKPEKSPLSVVEALAGQCRCLAADQVARAGGKGAGCDAERLQRAHAGAQRLIGEMHAIRFSREGPLRELAPDLASGCVDFDASVDGTTVLQEAAASGRNEWIALALQHGGEPGVLRGISAAAFFGASNLAQHDDPLRLALAAGADPNLPMMPGAPPPLAQAGSAVLGVNAVLATAPPASRPAALRSRELALRLVRDLLSAGADLEAPATQEFLARARAQDKELAALLAAPRR